MTTISSRIQKSLALRIVSGELKPGAKLDEKVLASEFGVSRTPIREALRELGVRGLIELVAHRGGIVAQISVEQLADMLDGECELEGLCARLSALRMSAVEKGTLDACHDEAKALTQHREIGQYLTINQTFHDLICEGAHNKTLTGMTRDLRLRLAPFRQTQEGNQITRLSRSHEEHAQIVDAILKGDPDAAYEAMRSHNARLSSGILALLRSGAERGAVASSRKKG